MFNGDRVSAWRHTLNCRHQKVCKTVHLKFHACATTEYTIKKTNHWKARSLSALGTITMMCSRRLEPSLSSPPGELTPGEEPPPPPP